MQNKNVLPTQGSNPHIARLIAFYLPQFHPIPENDKWWGKGFTEWTNVAKARPLFPGHYQPHIPADLGFYDLRVPEVRQSQAELAQEHGIHGFCYYHYWFNGKRLLERPLDEMLQSGKPDFPFCLCWANENWTRRWDGQETDLLIQQNYSDADDTEHIRWLARVFQDERYIRVDNKPLFLVYRVGDLPDPCRTTSIWRAEAQRLGIGELFLCRVESNFPLERGDPRKLGYDAAVEFQPDGFNLPPRLGIRRFSSVRRLLGRPKSVYEENRVCDYASLIQKMLAKDPPDYPSFPCVTPSWDNSPRRKKHSVILHNSTPDLYEEWLSAILKRESSLDAKDRVVFINAWNEWAEGCHLEPDLRHGRAYLEATRRALLGSL